MDGFDDKEIRKADKLSVIVILICVIFVILGICSCRSIQYVPVETVKTNTEYRDRIQRDSIHVRDSVFVLVNGDTVYIERWRDRWRDRVVYDTAYIYRCDSIQVPYPVEKKLSFWQRVKMNMGAVVLFLMPVMLVVIGWLAYKKRNK